MAKNKRKRQKIMLKRLQRQTATVRDHMQLRNDGSEMQMNQFNDSAELSGGKKILSGRQKLRRKFKANQYRYFNASRNAQQIATQKLVKSIKKRNIRHTSPSSGRHSFLNLSNNRSAKSSFNNNGNVSATLRSDCDESDCILVETPPTPPIVIDDDDDCDDKIIPTNFNNKENSIFTPGFLSINQLIKRANERSSVNEKTLNENQRKPESDLNLHQSIYGTCNISEVQKQHSPVSKMSATSTVTTTTNADTSIKPVHIDIEKKSLSINQKTQNLTIDESAIIILDETGCDSNESINDAETTIKENDNSVIFVSETKINMDYIPLESSNVPNPIKMPEMKKRTHIDSQNVSLYTKKQKKEIEEYNANTYNPNSGIALNPGKRLVLLDASNVAFHHGCNKQFSVKGIQICIDHFVKMGHEVKAVLPQYRLKRNKSTDPDALQKLTDDNFLVLTPSKSLIDGRTFSSHDDRCLLQFAIAMDAAVVSNDNYRDIANECLEFQRIIKTRVIGFTWCKDVLIIPKDPYGRNGPDLKTILNRT